ncbi:hypothetical protein ACFZDJ_54310 [Streptomyces sp. NPDC007896]|uniref:hypothetical protein n=1 Tax=Streptomyces sp. NPDC007896 TaxID=3364784 RepID=UPI0036EE469E
MYDFAVPPLTVSEVRVWGWPDFGYDFAWCYPKDPELVEQTVREWDADTQDEPTGWHKRSTREIRQAPRRDEQPTTQNARLGNPSRAPA